jgi:cytosine/adenosine deaminase-related metal-dependent hydrolase
MDVGDHVPPALLEDCDRSLADAAVLGDRWHGAADGRLSYAVAPRFALSCSSALLRGCAELARSNGWILQTHAAENRDEIKEVRRLSGLGNIEYLAGHGLLGDDVVLAHGVHLDDHEIRLLADSSTTICHCPGANLKLASGIADIPRLLSNGVVVALGADGPPCNNRLSIFHEMSLAATIHSLRHGPTAINAWQVLEMATRGGAAALGLDSDIGSIEPGKAADLVAVDLMEWSALPGGDPASRIVYGGSPQSVRHTVVAGRTVVEDKTLLTTNPEALRERVAAAWTATRARMEDMS